MMPDAIRPKTIREPINAALPARWLDADVLAVDATSAAANGACGEGSAGASGIRGCCSEAACIFPMALPPAANLSDSRSPTGARGVVTSG